MGMTMSFLAFETAMADTDFSSEALILLHDYHEEINFEFLSSYDFEIHWTEYTAQELLNDYEDEFDIAVEEDDTRFEKAAKLAEKMDEDSYRVLFNRGNYPDCFVVMDC